MDETVMELSSTDEWFIVLFCIGKYNVVIKELLFPRITTEVD